VHVAALCAGVLPDTRRERARRSIASPQLTGNDAQNQAGARSLVAGGKAQGCDVSIPLMGPIATNGFSSTALPG